MKPKHIFASILPLTALLFGMAAQANDDLVVYIECNKDGKISQGSGVLVSDDGLFLTARHVVPEGASCKASIGDNTLALRKVRPNFRSEKIAPKFDAILMEFGNSRDLPKASFCPISPSLKGHDIVAKGFHGDSFGAPSETEGVLSVGRPDPEGMIETTAMTINGKSGGPVFLKGTNTIVGIIAGAEFTAQGTVSSYKMLAIDTVGDDLDLLKGAEVCNISQPTTEPKEADEGLANTLTVSREPQIVSDLPLSDDDTTTVTTSSTTVEDPNFPEDVTGYNAVYVEYDTFHFQRLDTGDWVHHDMNHNMVGLNGTFFEFSKDEYNIVLVEYFTEIVVRFAGLEQTIYWWNGDELIDQRVIKKVK